MALPAVALRRHAAAWRRALLAACVIMIAVHSAGSHNTTSRRDVSDVLVVAGYLLGQYGLVRAFLASRRSGRRPRALVPIGLSLLPLVLVKAAPLLSPESRIGFLGVSYVTFRCLDILIAINDGLVQSVPFGTFITFVFFFPTVSAGPIDRYRRFVADLERPASAQDRVADVDHGVQRLFTGLLYKFVLAALINAYALEPLDKVAGLWPTVAYMYAYSAYLFFDFAGYSAIAVGASYLLGIRTPENFDRPFLARNIVEFWNRWHITLSAWFRDQIYMRFLLAATKRKWFRDRRGAAATGLFVTFAAMGLWHGFTIRYIVYGMYHGTLLAGYTFYADWNRRRGRAPAGGWSRVWSTLLTAHAVMFSFLIFSGRLIP